jgi:asparagine synthase (glutamine-hydrolysing)
VVTHIARRPLGAPHLSPLADVVPVVPGDACSLRDPMLRPVSVWRPASWTRRAADLAPADLRATVLETVSAMAAVEPRIALEVSGGLDSAVVAAALVETGHRHRIGGALNYFSPRAAGDERPWAVAICEAKGLPLDAIAQQVGVLTEADFSELAPHIGPAFGGVDVHYDRDVGARAAAMGACAVFGGQGGDAVFFQMPTAAVAADYLAATSRHGLGDPFVVGVARWLRRSVWSVRDEARSDRRWIGVDHALSTKFWGPRARAAAEAAPHPWLSDLDGVPPGKQVQIQSILGSQANWGRSRRAAAARVVNPLLAQPILEMCLAAPSWRLVTGVRDRGLARLAFAPLLPQAVVQRRSKGALNALFSQRAAASLEFLRPHLLDGVLVGAGVLDGRALEDALQPDSLIWRAEGGRLTRLALLESWLRYWQTRVPDVVATGRASAA